MLGLLALAALSGCAYQRYHTETPRSATEQLLISRAMEGAIAELEWPTLSERSVAVEIVALNQGDAPYLRALAEAHLREMGARVVPRERAEAVVALLAGALGTVSREAGFGIPSLTTPFGVQTPALTLARVLKQRGYARLRLVAWDRDGAQLASSAPVLERASFEVYGLFFLVLRRNDIYPAEGFSLGLD